MEPIELVCPKCSTEFTVDGEKPGRCPLCGHPYTWEKATTDATPLFEGLTVAEARELFIKEMGRVR